MSMTDDQTQTQTQTYRTAITTVGGDVFISLPGDQYIEMTPDKARHIAVALFNKAAEAEGLQHPEVIVLKKGGA